MYCFLKLERVKIFIIVCRLTHQELIVAFVILVWEMIQFVMPNSLIDYVYVILSLVDLCTNSILRLVFSSNEVTPH